MLGVQPPFGRNYGRSMVIARQGIAATSQVLASQAGAQILSQGGSAADAAIAANAVLGVVEPMMNGIGGDLFVLYWEAATGKLTGLNASGPAPRALSPEFLARRNIHSMADAGVHAVTVPGAVDGWAKMHQRFGKLPWKHLFHSACSYASQGFPVSEIVAELWAGPRTPSAFLVDGNSPKQGEVFRNASLARAYGLLSEQGPRAFYEGEIAAAMLLTQTALGGTMCAEDLSSFSSEWVEPISIDYRGWRVFELPPNDQGMAALEMLNIVEAVHDLQPFPHGRGSESSTGPRPPGSGQNSGSGRETGQSAHELHTRIEAMKLAYVDCYRYNGDPRHAKIPVEELLSKDHARKRAALIDPRRANGSFEAARVPGSDTVYLTIVDREGNIASWIQSVYAGFGSGIVVDGMGFVLQNRGAGFSLDPGHPNVLAGGKRPYHTIIPGFMERGDVHIGFGIMGGANQPLAHAQFVSNVVDHGMNLQAAMEAPRFFKGEPSGLDVAIESRVPESVLNELSAFGHQLIIRDEYSQEMGRGQAITHDSSTGVNFAASDARADGAAVPDGI